MLRKKHAGGRMPNASGPADRNPLNAYAARFVDACGTRGFSERTIESQARALKRFIVWCDERDIRRVQDITLPIIERYQRHLYHCRKANGEPLSFTTQKNLLIPLKMFFKWATRERYVLCNPASEVALPRVAKRLPQLLSVTEVETIINQTDIKTPNGVRDRALLELLYSSGIRRMELVRLTVYDLDLRGGSLWVRQGKGGKDRIVPLGARAAAWVSRYLNEVRPLLVTGHDDGVCFLTDFGESFEKSRLGELVKRYIARAGVKVIGACHLFRHAMATHMLDNGADIRYLQMILGHAQLTTTEIYTHVSIQKLKQIHAATHPARLHRAQGLRPAPTEVTASNDVVACSADVDANALLSSLAADNDDDDASESPTGDAD